MTYIIFALINGLHNNNKLETSVVQLFELIKNRLLQIFKYSQNQETAGSRFGGGGIGRSGLQNQRSIGSGYFKNIRQMAVSMKNLVKTQQL